MILKLPKIGSWWGIKKNFLVNEITKDNFVVRNIMNDLEAMSVKTFFLDASLGLWNNL